MSQYVDANVYLTIYLNEPEQAAALILLRQDPAWTSAAHTEVEVRRNLVRELRGDPLARARQAFDADWAKTEVVELDDAVCKRAAQIAEATGIKTLDALHLAAAGPVRPAARLVTYDRKLAETARTFGWAVSGA